MYPSLQLFIHTYLRSEAGLLEERLPSLGMRAEHAEQLGDVGVHHLRVLRGRTPVIVIIQRILRYEVYINVCI
jgi:hypothetical protein